MTSSALLRSGPFAHKGGIEVKQDGEIGRASLRSKQRELLYHVHADAARGSLVGNTGIKAAVSNHQRASFQIGQDQRCKVLCAVGLEQECFRERRYGKIGTMNQELAYFAAERRPSWFTRTNARDAALLQPVSQ